MSFAITAVYAGLFGLVFLVLAFMVVRGRRRAHVGLGVGGDEALERAVRAHANFVEYVPLALLLLLVAELNGAHAAWLYANGAVLLVARILHGWGLSHTSGRSFGRFYGTLLTWIVMLLLALTNLYQGLIAG